MPSELPVATVHILFERYSEGSSFLNQKLADANKVGCGPGRNTSAMMESTLAGNRRGAYDSYESGLSVIRLSFFEFELPLANFAN